MTWILKQEKYLLTLGNDTVHKPHGEAKEDEVMQVVHLEHKIILLTLWGWRTHSNGDLHK